MLLLLVEFLRTCPLDLKVGIDDLNAGIGMPDDVLSDGIIDCRGAGIFDLDLISSCLAISFGFEKVILFKSLSTLLVNILTLVL